MMIVGLKTKKFCTGQENNYLFELDIEDQVHIDLNFTCDTPVHHALILTHTKYEEC